MVSFISIFLFIIVPVLSFTAKNQYQECENWMRMGECLKNPRFMLSECAPSCRKEEAMVDQRQECKHWAENGECSRNSGMLIDCSASCGHQLIWNQFARGKLNIPQAKGINEEETETDLLSGFCERDNARYFLNATIYLINSIEQKFENGFNAFTPNIDLFSIGLSEELLYALRHGEKTIELMNEENLKVYDNNLNDEIDFLHTLMFQRNYDAITRSAPRIFKRMKDIVLILKNMESNNKYEEVCPWINNESDNETKLKMTDKMTLLDGNTIPIVGLGTWRLQGETCKRSVIEALKIGYRHIDTADAYNNEVEVGEAMIESGVPRGEIYLTTKLSKLDDMGYENARRKVMEQLQKLKTNYIDLYMLHSPMGTIEQQQLTWKALEEFVDQGVIKSLGISNYNQDNLENLLNWCRHKPVILENKLDIYHIGTQLNPKGENLINYPIKNTQKNESIKLLGYSTLNEWPFVMKSIKDPHILILSQKYNKTPQQILLRWAMQIGTLIIPQSSNQIHLLQNTQIFDFTLNSLDVLFLNQLHWFIQHPFSLPISF